MVLPFLLLPDSADKLNESAFLTVSFAEDSKAIAVVEIHEGGDIFSFKESY